VLSDFTPGGTFTRFELQQVLPLLLDVLSGLSALHALVEDGCGFVHGEVSPRYIYVGDNGRARLVPLVARHGSRPTLPTASGYAAPELLLGDQVDARADIFSVGVMLWEALAGKPLFPDPSLEAVVMRLLGGQIPPLTPPPSSPWARPLCEIAERAISSYAALRFQSAEELSQAIQRAVGPQRAKRPRDTWLDDAPTLLLAVTGPGRAELRRLTPLSSVLDLPADAPFAEPLPESASPVAAARVRTRPSRWSRLGDVMLTLVVLVALAATVVLLLSKSRPNARQPAAAVAPASRPESTPAASSSGSAAAWPSPSSSAAPAPSFKRRERSTKAAPAPNDYGI